MIAWCRSAVFLVLSAYLDLPGYFNMGFEVILMTGVILTGLTAIIRFSMPARLKEITVIKEVANFFPVLLLVFAGRSFAFEPFRIPSGSMKPVFFEGDFIIIDKFSHGLRWPVTGRRITNAKPSRGDIVVFRGKINGEDSYIIKRIIGVPGDNIEYKKKRLYVNGESIEKTFVNYELDKDIVSGNQYPVLRYHEKLDNIEYDIYNYPFVERTAYPFESVEVPEGKYFVMGNNRDNSADSRYFGLLDDNKVVGRARLIFFSYTPKSYKLRWDRVGPVI